MKDTYTVAIIRQYNQFISIIKKEPIQFYTEKWIKHIFVYNFQKDLNNINVEVTVFYRWIDRINKKLIDNTLDAISIKASTNNR